MEKRITFVGLDAHKEWIKVAALLPGESKAVEWQVANEKAAVRRMLRKLERLSPGGGEVRLCYEAGHAATRCNVGSRMLARCALSWRRRSSRASREIGSRPIGATHASWLSSTVLVC